MKNKLDEIIVTASILEFLFRMATGYKGKVEDIFKVDRRESFIFVSTGISGMGRRLIVLFQIKANVTEIDVMSRMNGRFNRDKYFVNTDVLKKFKLKEKKKSAKS